MLMNQSLYDLGRLRQNYAKAQASVNGRVLERPSEDPQRVVEAMDLSGAKLRLERATRSGEDAREWLVAAESSVSNMIDRLQAVFEVTVQAGSPSTQEPESREALARQVEIIRESLMRELNNQHREQYLFAGWKTDTQPFSNGPGGSAAYTVGDNQLIQRDIAPGLSIAVNVPGSKLVTPVDFMKTLTDIAADLRAGRTLDVTGPRAIEVKKALDGLNLIRADLGIRQRQVSQYEEFAQDAVLVLEERLTDLTGGDLETAVLRMTEAQSAYQAALASFAKTLPTSLIDFMLR